MNADSLQKTVQYPRLTFSAVLRHLGYSDAAPDREIPLHHCFAVWVHHLLSRLPFLDSEQRQLLFHEFAAEVTPETIDKLRTDTVMLVFADMRYAIWNSRTQWLDLQSGDYVDRLPVPALETFGYNLSVLLNRQLAQS